MEAERGSEYSASELKGIKVAHDKNAFQEGEEVILTLKDRSILKDGNQIDEDVDELENIEMFEQEKRQWNKDATKSKYSVYDALEGKTTSILPQYDEDKTTMQRATFELDESSGIDEQKKKRLEQIRNRLKAPGAGLSEGGVTVATAEGGKKTMYTLNNDLNKMVARDYYTPEEMQVTFKKTKTKKNKKVRQKSAAVAEEPTTISEATNLELLAVEDSARDHGSRNRSTKLERDEEMADIDRETRTSAYQKALEKAKEKSQFLHKTTVGIQDGDDDMLLQSIERARRLAEKKSQSETVVLSALEIAKREEEERKKREAETGGVVFNPTAEFVRSIHLEDETTAAETPAPVTKKEKKEEDVDMQPAVAVAVAEEARPQIKHEQDKASASASASASEADEGEQRPVAKGKKQFRPRGGASADVKTEDEEFVEAEKKKIKSESIEELEEELEEVIPDEPIVAKGLGAALAFAQQHGMLAKTDEYVGRNRDKAVLDVNKPDDEIKLEYRDKFGRLLTQKEAFRELSHKFHGKLPGKNKQDKLRKKYLQELEKKKLASQDNTDVVEALRKTTEATQQPYVVLPKNVSFAAENPKDKKKKDEAYMSKKKRKMHL
eukprot:GEZU01042246.1.p1 GENE.GEZU01042246.1~~GEZU01042246.1.p1  ORF type:complete len:608 (+),score=243.58 GEZU01042246.1:939-2762(+)